jgi:toluene monooxygenase electron transfer component
MTSTVAKKRVTTSFLEANADESEMKVTVETKAEKVTFPCEEQETILFAGLCAGVALPYECATGTCGSCHARVVEGDVSPGWTRAPAYSQLKLEKGDILMCQSVPMTDCVIRARNKVSSERANGRQDLYWSGIIDVVTKLNEDVIHFEVRLDRAMTFVAGQFVTLEVEGVTGRRAYSMVNFDETSSRLTFVIKRKPGGGFSNWIFGKSVMGRKVKIGGPLGRATFRPHEHRHPIIIAGGSGIAGMMSMLKHAGNLDYFREREGDVFFGVRTLKDSFYLRELNEHAKRAGPSLRVVLALSDEDPPAERHPDFPGISIERGFVHDVASRRMSGKWDERVGFVAGPPLMVNGALKVLIAEGKLPQEFIRFDKFS